MASTSKAFVQNLKTMQPKKQDNGEQDNDEQNILNSFKIRNN